MKNNIGIIGEQTAALYLVANGFEVLHKNWHCRYGEVDIIAQNDDFFAFIEVKTRAANAMVSGEEAVDINKQNKLRLTAQMFLQNHLVEKQLRFDVIIVEHNKSRNFSVKNHIMNAF